MIRTLLILHWILAVAIAMVLVFVLFLVVKNHGGGNSFAFAGGLAVIGGALSLLAWPVSIQLTKPLERLETSALRIAEGDLSVRTHIEGEHTIGRQLAQAFNIMAERVERMVRSEKELIANISHELRSPLTRIRIAGECLKESLERDNPEDAQEMLQAMWEDIEEADRMIGRILEFAKVDLHEPLIATGDVVPAEVIKGLVKMLAPFARSRQIQLTLEPDFGAHVAGDEEWLRAAFKNLLENALRYTDPGGIVRAAVRNSPDGVVVEVTNSFPPLGPEELEAIFKPFYRGQTTNSEGTGLGLAIVKKIVTLHHGQVGARNVPEGFQVWIILPNLPAIA